MLKIGDKVCVNSILNVIMYCRACITDIIDDKYSVFYLDYGNTEIVNAEDIMDLPKELEKVRYSLSSLKNKFFFFLLIKL